MANNFLGYMMIEGTDSSLRGVALITDTRGIPKEFVRTDPLRPEALDRILYGESFSAYAKQSLILENLLDAVSNDPQIWICNDEEILEPLKTVSRIKSVMLEESPHVPLDAHGHIETSAEPNVYLIQAYVNGAPLRAEFPEGTRTDEVEQSAGILTEAGKSMNILEPFNRLQKSLSYLATGRA